MMWLTFIDGLPGVSLGSKEKSTPRSGIRLAEDFAQTRCRPAPAGSWPSRVAGPRHWRESFSKRMMIERPCRRCNWPRPVGNGPTAYKYIAVLSCLWISLGGPQAFSISRLVLTPGVTPWKLVASNSTGPSLVGDRLELCFSRLAERPVWRRRPVLHLGPVCRAADLSWAGLSAVLPGPLEAGSCRRSPCWPAPYRGRGLQERLGLIDGCRPESGASGRRRSGRRRRRSRRRRGRRALVVGAVVGGEAGGVTLPLEAVRTALAAPLSTSASGVASISRTPVAGSGALSVGVACCAAGNLPAKQGKNRKREYDPEQPGSPGLAWPVPP